MLKLATILDNPGEPTAKTRYRDPNLLKQLGYNGLVLYETTGLSGLVGPDSVESGELRRWITKGYDHVRAITEQANEAGLDVYLTYDVLSLARSIVDDSPGRFVCKNRPGTLCPASEDTLNKSVEALDHLMRTFGDAAGVVLRIGDNDAGRLPYLVGNDLYAPHCPRCSQFGRADRIVSVLTRFYEMIVGTHNKRLIARAWNLRPNGMHDSVELCERIRDRLPGEETDDRFVLSFKYTQTDFWRYQPWNQASLCFGQRPIMYELQCQREFEGKGGIPNWQVPIWRDGDPAIQDEDQRGGLAKVTSKINFSGLWAWVRGGGWGGPFVANEDWIDANVYAVPRLAENPSMPCNQLAEEWVDKRVGVPKTKTKKAICDVLEASVQFILDGFYIGPYASNKADSWHPNADWISDDLVDAEAAWRMILQLSFEKLDQVGVEKNRAVAAVSEVRQALHKQINEANRSRVEPMFNTLMYTESLYSAISDLLQGMVAFRQWRRSKEPTHAEKARHRLLSSQSHWNHHCQRHANLSGTATAFRESGFWDLTQKLLGEMA
jgi:hypothetical protein